jgi:hypothetical protein
VSRVRRNRNYRWTHFDRPLRKRRNKNYRAQPSGNSPKGCCRQPSAQSPSGPKKGGRSKLEDLSRVADFGAGQKWRRRTRVWRAFAASTHQNHANRCYLHFAIRRTITRTGQHRLLPHSARLSKGDVQEDFVCRHSIWIHNPHSHGLAARRTMRVHVANQHCC